VAELAKFSSLNKNPLAFGRGGSFFSEFEMKFIFVTGGVISGTGKGVAAASIGLLLKARGHKVQIIKCDPYLNVNAGILAPREHGECFLADDGTETDLDLGHYERIAGITVSEKNIYTSGTLYKELIEEQEDGKWLGQTIQVIPHVTDKIGNRLKSLAEDAEIVICEIGGTVGDLESGAFYMCARQFKQKYGDNCILVHVAPILWVPTIQEFKTKPLQRSVQDLQSNGLLPDVLLCRVDQEVPTKLLDKVANMTGVPRDSVFDAPDVRTIYQVPIEFYNRHIDDLIADKLRLKRNGCRIHKHREKVEKYIDNDLPRVRIGIFGKYDNCDEAYISLKEALLHAGLANDVKVEIKWVVATELEKYKDMRGVHQFFDGVHGMIIPGGFDSRGVEGKIKAIRYVREKKIPFLGICLGLQCGVIEFARNVCQIEGANSTEFDKKAEHPVITFVEGQENLRKKSGTMRLGAYDCELVKDTLAYQVYKKKLISERHRHRYEVNDDYVDQLAEKGLLVSGRNPQTNLVEMVELDQEQHPYFIATQAHPEFKSRLTDPAPLFVGLVENAIKYAQEETQEI
jgi:CTP synthase